MVDCSPAATQFRVGSHTLKIEVSGSRFLVACVNNVILSIKSSKYKYCCHYCRRVLRCLQRKSVLLLSEVNGSVFVPRCTVIMAQRTDFLSSDPVFC